jgi:hypothetical protein
MLADRFLADDEMALSKDRSIVVSPTTGELAAFGTGLGVRELELASESASGDELSSRDRVLSGSGVLSS